MLDAAELPVTDFADLFRIHYPRLVRALRASGASSWLAEDLAQEAFARTLRHWRRVRTGANPAGYPFRVGFRLLRKRGLLQVSADDERPGPAGGDVATQAVDRVDLERALAAMPPRRRACVVLTCYAGLSTADVAEALSIAQGTVRKQLELARPTLRGLLAETD